MEEAEGRSGFAGAGMGCVGFLGGGRELLMISEAQRCGGIGNQSETEQRQRHCKLAG